MESPENNISINCKAKIWKKETEDLFDFDSNEITQQDIQISSTSENSYLIEQNDTLSSINSIKDLILSIENSQNNIKILSELTLIKIGLFKITNPLRSENLKNVVSNKSELSRTWSVLPKNTRTEIKEGNIIKIGRIRLKIDKINFKSNENKSRINKITTTVVGVSPSFSTIQNNFLYKDLSNSNIAGFNQITNNSFCGDQCDLTKNTYDKVKEGAPYCRICYQSEESDFDPLLCPCQCLGTIGYIHYVCLKKCIETKLTKKNDENCKFYTWKAFECEICKKEYPKCIKYKDKTLPLLDMEINFNDYIIFDYSVYEDNEKKTFRKGVIVHSMEDNEEIAIGRTDTNNIKLKEISVSRKHCSILRKKNKVFLVDKGSKFGSLLYINDYILFGIDEGEQNPILNSGRYSLQFTMSKDWSFLSLFGLRCCNSKQINDSVFLLDENSKQNCKTISKHSKKKTNANNEQINDSYDDYILVI